MQVCQQSYAFHSCISENFYIERRLTFTSYENIVIIKEQYFNIFQISSRNLQRWLLKIPKKAPYSQRWDFLSFPKYDSTRSLCFKYITSPREITIYSELLLDTHFLKINFSKVFCRALLVYVSHKDFFLNRPKPKKNVKLREWRCFMLASLP